MEYTSAKDGAHSDARPTTSLQKMVIGQVEESVGTSMVGCQEFQSMLAVTMMENY